MPKLFTDPGFYNALAILVALVGCVYGLYTHELTLATAAGWFSATVGALRVAVAIEGHGESTVQAAQIRAGVAPAPEKGATDAKPA